MDVFRMEIVGGVVEVPAAVHQVCVKRLCVVLELVPPPERVEQITAGPACEEVGRHTLHRGSRELPGLGING